MKVWKIIEKKHRVRDIPDYGMQLLVQACKIDEIPVLEKMEAKPLYIRIKHFFMY